MKRTRPIQAETILEPYGLKLNIIFTSDLVAAADTYHISSENMEGRAGFAACSDGDGEQWLGLDYAGLSYGVIAHESLHIVYNVMKQIGQPLEGGEEAAAYLLQHIFDCVVTAAKAKKIDISPL
jgi:hypothetical protein